jgi:hypothetical protein
MKKITKIMLVLAVFALGLAPVASNAAEFVAPNRTDNGTVVIGSGETYKNLYTAGSSVFVNSNVQGDLAVAGGTILIDGAIEQDLFAAGGTITVNGRVGSDARLGGGTVMVNSEINGDLLVGGGETHITEKARVAGDVIIGGGNVVIEAPVAGGIMIAGGAVTINSQVGGSVDVRAGGSVVFGERARVPGKVTVKAPQEPVVESGAEVSTPEFTRIEQLHNECAVAGLFTLWFLVKILAYILAGLLLLYIMPRRSMHVLRTMRGRFWPNVGIGLVVAIVVPIVALIALFTLVGYYVALIAFVWYAMVLLLACLFAALFLGSWILQKLMKKPELVFDWQAVVVGSAVYVILGIIPVIGWIIQAILSLAAIGAFMRITREQIRQGESV